MKNLKIMRKRKFKNRLWKIGIILFGILLTLTNCEKENELLLENSSQKAPKIELSKKSQVKEYDEINNAKLWFEQNKELNNFNILQHTFSINWEYAFISKKNGKNAIEVPLTLNNEINIIHKKYKNSKTFNRLLIVPSKKDNTYNSFIVNILQFDNPKDFNNKSSLLNYFQLPKSFDGLITVLNNENKIVQKKEFLQGKPTKVKKKVAISSKGEQPDYTCVYFGWWYEDGTFEPITLLYCYGGGSGNPGAGIEYPGPEEPANGSPGSGYSEVNGCPEGYIPDPDGGCVEDIKVVVDEPDNPIIDLEDFLKCFDPSEGGIVTIYVNQPKANSDVVVSLKDKAGHAFVSISQGNNESVFGFYPTDTASPLNPSDQSSMGNDSQSPYDISISLYVDASTLLNVINHSIDYNPTYNLNNYNCTDFVIEMGNICGLNLPDCYSSWTGGGGSSPAILGQHIRNNFSSDSKYTISLGGNSPSNKKDC